MTKRDILSLRNANKLITVVIATGRFTTIPLMQIFCIAESNAIDGLFVVVTREGIEKHDKYIDAVNRGSEGLDYAKFQDASKCAKYIRLQMKKGLESTA